MQRLAEILFTVAAGVTNLWSLAAFALAVVAFILAKRTGKTPPAVWLLIAVLVLGPIALSTYQTIATQTIYRVRVTVVDPQNTPVEDARVWSTMGGEPKHVAGGWQFDIPAGSRPQDGKLTLYAEVPTKFLRGSSALVLGNDYNPNVTIQLKKDISGKIRGIVIDRHQNAILGASVNVAGYENEAVLTGHKGNFELPAHAAIGQQVQLHVECSGFEATDQGHPVSDTAATVILVKKGDVSLIPIDDSQGNAQPEADLLPVYVTDTYTRALRGVVLGPTGDGSVSRPTDIAGRTHIRLASNTGPGDWVTLQLIRGPGTPPPWRMISPWDGRVAVPALRGGSDYLVKVVLGRSGERITAEHSLTLLAIVANVLDAYGPGPVDENAEKDPRLAIAARQARHFGIEPSELNRVVAEWGTQAEVPFERGMAALYMKDYRAAVQYLSSASDVKQNVARQVDANYFLGLALYEQEKYDQAAKIFHKATLLRSHDISLVRGEAAALYKAKQFAAAERTVREHLPFQFFPLEPSVEARTSGDMGNLLAGLRQYRDAFNLQSRALALRRNDHDSVGEAQTLQDIGSILKNAGKLDLSLNWYQGALEKTQLAGDKREQVEILNNLGKLYIDLGLEDRALEVLEDALASAESLEQEPSIAISFNNLGELSLKTSKWDEAESLFVKALKLGSIGSETANANLAAVNNNLGLVYLRQKRYKEAEALFKESLSIWEQLPPSHLAAFNETAENYSRLLVETNRTAEAVAIMTLVDRIGAAAPAQGSLVNRTRVGARRR